MMMMMMIQVTMRMRELKNSSHYFLMGTVFTLICWTWMTENHSLSWSSLQKRDLEQDNFLMEIENVMWLFM
jgi:hypothetical protein